MKVRAIILDAPEAAYRALALLPLDISDGLQGKFAYVRVFITSQSASEAAFQKTRRHLGPWGMLSKLLWASSKSAKRLIRS